MAKAKTRGIEYWLKNYLVLDLETTTKKAYKRKANPFLAENRIVMRGWKKPHYTLNKWSYHTEDSLAGPLTQLAGSRLLVAHNAKFELLYEMRYSWEELIRFFQKGGRIWCTQYAEYLLQGQQKKWQMASLNDCAKYYGGTPKIDVVKELWDAGVDTPDIDRDLLTDYLVGTEEEERCGGDIGNTELVFLEQIKAAKDMGMLDAIWRRMDGLLCTSYMEFAGLKIDRARAIADRKLRVAELKEATTELGKYTGGMPEGLVFNWNSGIHKSCLIFGGTIKYEKPSTYIDEKTGDLARLKATEKWPLINKEAVDPRTLPPPVDGVYAGQDVYVSGKRIGEPRFRNVPVQGALKTRITPFFYECPGYMKPEPEWAGANVDGAGEPVYSTSKDVMEEVELQGIPFTNALGEFNKLTKEIGTYYWKTDSKGDTTGMLTCVGEDHVLHPKLNHTSTVTTRLSSTDPNLQNLTRADFNAVLQKYKSTVKAMFISRFVKDGCMIEIDYKQLEVVVQALLTLDRQLCKDLCAGVDFHCKRVALKCSVSYDFALFHCKNEDAPDHDRWSVERTGCKIFSFQRAYGAGAKLVSLSTGIPIDDVKFLMAEEDKEYPGVPLFNAAVEQEVLDTCEPFYDPERKGSFRAGTYTAVTGTQYRFRSYPPFDWQKERGINDTFSPTEMKNYPIQGTGGELVQMILGVLIRWLISKNFYDGKVFLVNTVHDCVWFDCHKSIVHEVVDKAVEIMENIPKYLDHFFGIDCPVPFPVDAEIGPNMLELHHYGDAKANEFLCVKESK